MTDEEIAQLGRELSWEEKDTLIRNLCGPEEAWNKADGEFVMKLYGVDPSDPRLSIVAIVEGAVRKFRERGEEVPQSLLNILAKLQKKAKHQAKE